MAADQNPGETLDEYRIRKLEENYDALDGKVDALGAGQVEIKTTLNNLVATSTTRTTNASTLRIGITVGLIVSALGLLIWAVETAITAYVHLQGGGTP